MARAVYKSAKVSKLEIAIKQHLNNVQMVISSKWICMNAAVSKFDEENEFLFFIRKTPRSKCIQPHQNMLTVKILHSFTTCWPTLIVEISTLKIFLNAST